MMDLELSESELLFRDEIRAWLSENIPASAYANMDTEEGFEQHRGWEAKLNDARWSVPHWPARYGGRDCSLVE